ncbi:MAG: hypothetical protein HY291_05440 [Planctomycetes bacterium]|nr:hypothetical protein [Planctomycetota bacterium]
MRIETLFFVCSLFVSTSVVAAETVTGLPEEEFKAMELLVEKVVGLGMPDAKGAVFYAGEASISQKFDPDRDEPVLPMRYCKTQMTNSGTKEMTYGFDMPGPHLKLKDGSWVIGLLFMVRPKDGISVGSDKLEERKIEGAVEAAAKKHRFDAAAKLKVG